MKTLVLTAAIIAQVPNYPCQSIDPANCQQRPDRNALAPTFKSVSAQSIIASVFVDTSTYPTTGKIPEQ